MGVKKVDNHAPPVSTFPKAPLSFKRIHGMSSPRFNSSSKGLPISGIPESTLIFNSPKHFVAYYALPHLWVPRYPP
ncbi:hypothetical protein JHK82_017839 [Glycine max]|nr:hypothetical protein JHK82_017839 [Glycine max]KAH1085900.1 hypothetical protein GYH30_017729 [Glycine max]